MTLLKTAIIVANGPSLADVPNEWLNKYHTFGANRIYLREGFVPTYYGIVDKLMVGTPELAQAAVDFMPKVERTFLSGVVAEEIRKTVELPEENVTVSLLIEALDGATAKPKPGFSQTPGNRIYHGFTVTYFNIQWAAGLGYRRLLLVGLDHNFHGPRGHHFDPKYSDGVDIDYENPASFSTEAFQDGTAIFFLVAKDYYQRGGGEIINCTPGSSLVTFPIDTWENY